MTYQTGIYRQQGGNKLIAQSSSAGAKKSGEIEVQSGASIDIQSGSSFSMDSAMEVGSGGYLLFESGAYQRVPYQTLTTTQTGTSVLSYGVSLLSASTTGPTYTMTAPAAAGIQKEVLLNPSSSGATHRAVIYSGSTGTAFVHQSGSGNQITLATSSADGVRLISTSATGWRVLRVSAVKDPALSNKST